MYLPIQLIYCMGVILLISIITSQIWGHGCYLPEKDATNLYGGFAGPVIIAEESPVNLGDTISKINVINADNGEAYDLSKAEVKFDYYPGKLVQTYDLENFKLTLELIFATNR
ncbi:hypothetical protein GNF82_17915, partial [Clostridium perfringens]